MILLTGGSGLLGKFIIKELLARKIKFIAPSHQEIDVAKIGALKVLFQKFKPSMVIHCAAIAKYKAVENDPDNAIKTNVVGTCNVAEECLRHNSRLIYISSDHVFDGKQGPYFSTDKVNPLTKYAKTKVAGELVTQLCENHLIIRTSFCESIFPFQKAYSDKWTSQDDVDKVAPKIVEMCVGNTVGIVHIGHKRRSFFQLAQERNPNIEMGTLSEISKLSPVPILVDTSLVVDVET